jgi:hypothetical protein
MAGRASSTARAPQKPRRRRARQAWRVERWQGKGGKSFGEAAQTNCYGGGGKTVVGKITRLRIVRPLIELIINREPFGASAHSLIFSQIEMMAFAF